MALPWPLRAWAERRSASSTRAYTSGAWRSSHVISVGPTLKEIFSKLLTMSRIRLALSTRRAAVLGARSEEHTSELQSRLHLVCRLLLEKKKKRHTSQCDIVSLS